MTRKHLKKSTALTILFSMLDCIQLLYHARYKASTCIFQKFLIYQQFLGHGCQNTNIGLDIRGS